MTDLEFTAKMWLEASRLWEDNTRFIKASSIRRQSRYIPEYLGILETFDKVFWSCNIKKIKTPLTFFDHFKVTFYPNWLLKRFPAKYKIFDVSAVFPRLDFNYDNIKNFEEQIKNAPKEDKIIVITQREQIK